MSLFTKTNFPNWFLVCVIIFTAHQFLQKTGFVNISLIDNYLDPLLAMPLLLQLNVLEKRFLWKKLNYRTPLATVILLTLFVIFLSEGLFPYLSKKFTHDYWDVLMFFLGASFFVFVTYRKPLVT